MITKEQAKKLGLGDVIYHKIYKNADGSPRRWRINGKIKEWKSNPEKFQIPIKHARFPGKLTDENCELFSLAVFEVVCIYCYKTIKWKNSDNPETDGFISHSICARCAKKEREKIDKYQPKTKKV